MIVPLGVDPVAWGEGIGTHLLDDAVEQARERHVASLVLWVLEDNPRALELYERAGWQRTTDLKSQIDSRRTEQRLQLTIA